MGAAMQLYAGFALLVIAIIVIIVIAALVSNLIGAVRRRFGKTRGLGRTRAHDDFSAPAPPSRAAPPASRSDTSASRSDDPPASR
jgi:peptidoglycan/LPS O-acetylase OafA/YrhL